jgi:Cys-rich protein (TIGR01571 family)
MSEKNFHPPPGQNTVREEQDINIEPMPQVHNVPTGPQQNIQPGQQPMPQQYIQPGQQPMPQIQYVHMGQQPMPQQQYGVGGQAMPQQQYIQQMSRQYYQQQPQMPGQVMPQYYQQMPGQQYPVGALPMQGPMAGQTPSPFLNIPLQPWTTELFDCAHDLENSLITAFFPCITFGQIADITDRGMSTCTGAGLIYGLLLYFTGFHWIYSWMYRTRMRVLYNLPEDPFHDCLVHFLCEPCALCQEYRELKNRGFNMQLGWIGNMQLLAQKEAAAGVPPPVQGMIR